MTCHSEPLLCLKPSMLETFLDFLKLCKTTLFWCLLMNILLTRRSVKPLTYCSLSESVCSACDIWVCDLIYVCNTDGQLTIQLQNKRDYFGFSIVIFPFLSPITCIWRGFFFSLSWLETQKIVLRMTFFFIKMKQTANKKKSDVYSAFCCISQSVSSVQQFHLHYLYNSSLCH
jgi:hypothetical protein